MTLPALPPEGSTDWYTHYEALDTNVRSWTVAGIDTAAANNTPAIQATIDTAEAAGGGIVRIPPGTYNLTTTISLPSHVIIEGAGIGATVLHQNGTNTPVIASASWLGTGSPLGGSAVRHMTIEGTTGTNAHGIVLRDYRSNLDNLRIVSAGGHGILATTADNTGTHIGSTLVENAYDRLIIETSGGWGFRVETDGPKLTDAFMGRINVVGVGGAGGISIDSSAGWSIGHIHTYGTFTGPGVEIFNAWSTWIHSAQIEHGWVGAGLYVQVQRNLHLGDISIAGNPTGTGTALLSEKAGTNPGDGYTIGTLTVIQDSTNPITALSWDNNACPVTINTLTIEGDHKEQITRLGGFGATAVRIWADARVDGVIRDNFMKTSLSYNGVTLGLATNEQWAGAGPITKTFSVNIPAYTSAIGFLVIGSAQFNNGSGLLAYTGSLLLSAKADTDTVAAILNPLGTPTGLTSGPTVTVSGTTTQRTVTVVFTPNSGNGYGASCALFIAP